MLLQHLLGLRGRQQLCLHQFCLVKPEVFQRSPRLLGIDPLPGGALRHQLVAGHRAACLQHLKRQRPQVRDPLLQQVGLGQHLADQRRVQRLDLRLQRPVDAAGQQRADRLGRAPAAVVAGGHGRLRPQRRPDGCEQVALEGADAVGRGHPALDGHTGGRLHNDAFNLAGTKEGPLHVRRPHGRRSVEHGLRVLFHRHVNAVTELPIQHDGAAADAADEIGRAKHVGQGVAEAHDGFAFVVHALVRVDFVQRSQRRRHLGLNQFRGHNHAVEFVADELVGRAVVHQHRVHDVVQQGAFVGVFGRRLGRHLLRQLDAGRAGDDPLGGRPADNIGMWCHLTFPYSVWQRYIATEPVAQVLNLG